MSAKFCPSKVPKGVDLTAQPDKPDEVMTPKQQENGWEEEDAAIHEGDANINEQNDVVVDEALDTDNSAESGEAANVRTWCIAIRNY